MDLLWYSYQNKLNFEVSCGNHVDLGEILVGLNIFFDQFFNHYHRIPSYCIVIKCHKVHLIILPKSGDWDQSRTRQTVCSVEICCNFP